MAQNLLPGGAVARTGIAVALAGTLLLASCGDDGGDAASPTTPVEDTATTVPSTTESDTDTVTGSAPDAPTRSIELPGDTLFPEGVAYDDASGTFFVSSSNDGTVFRGDLESGEVEVFLDPGADGRTSALGLAVDAGRDRLWVAGGTSQAVFAYELSSGELLAALEVPDAGEGSLVNDITVDANGDAWVTNSGAPVLYRVDGADDVVGELEVWLDYSDSIIPTDGPLLLNGIVATDDGYLLSVHTVTQQLFRIDRDSSEIAEVDTGDEGVGGDGLALDGTTLYGVTPTGVVVTELAADWSSGTVVDTMSDPSFAFATTVALVPTQRMLVVNSQFNAAADPDLPFTVSDVARGR